MRSPKVVNGLGLGFVGAIVFWLAVNFVKDPQYFLNIGLNGLTRGAIYAVVALGYTLVYGILQLINFAHGDVFALSGLVASTVMLSWLGITAASSNLALVGAILVTLLVTVPLFAVFNGTIERIAYKPLRNAPRLAPLITAVGMSFIVFNISLAVYDVDYKSGSDLIPQGTAFSIGDVAHLLEARDLARDHRAHAHRAELVRALDQAREGHACRRPGHGGVGDDGDRRQPDDLRHVLPRGVARSGRRARLLPRVPGALRHRASSSG